MIPWTQQTIDWMLRADAFTGYAQNLAAKLRPHLADCRTLCDLGCGLGLTDLALADTLDRIDCVDVNPAPLEALSRLAAEQGRGNLHPRCMDAKTLTGRWDAALLCLYGKAEDIPLYLPLAEKRLLIVTHTAHQAALSPAGHQLTKHHTAARVAEVLDALGLGYRREDFMLEYGQPFSTQAEAAAYVALYSKAPPAETVQAFLDQRLQPVTGAQERWYLPYHKRLTLLAVESR